MFSLSQTRLFLFFFRTCSLKKGRTVATFLFFLHTLNQLLPSPTHTYIYNMLEARLQTGALLKKVRRTIHRGFCDIRKRTTSDNAAQHHEWNHHLLFRWQKIFWGKETRGQQSVAKRLHRVLFSLFRSWRSRTSLSLLRRVASNFRSIFVMNNSNKRKHFCTLSTLLTLLPTFLTNPNEIGP